MKGSIRFTKREDVIKFLKSRNMEDSEIRWVCPRCGTENIGAYYSHGSPCGGCDNFIFPRLNLKLMLKDDEEATGIAKEIENYKHKIRNVREVISDLETELAEEKERLRELKDELQNLKDVDMSKVRLDW